MTGAGEGEVVSKKVGKDSEVSLRGARIEGKKKNTPLGTNTRVLSFWYRICFRIHLQYQDFESACRPIRCQAKEELSITHAGVRRESVCDEERERKRGFICAINR